MNVVDQLELWLEAVELDEVGELQASIARALALKLDEAQGSDSGAVAMAIAGIAKELRAVISDLSDATSDSGGFVTDLFSSVGDSANPGPSNVGFGGDEDRGRVGKPADALAAARSRRGPGGRFN